MFTGIVEEVGTVVHSDSGRLKVTAVKVLEGLKVGDSISVNGACLTITTRDVDSFSVDVVPETLRRTNLGHLSPGGTVDLERPVAVAGRLDGHIVQGHVDGTGTVEDITDDGEALLVTIKTPPPLMRYVVEKGFIAVDGISLTVVNCDRDSFVFTVIPYTQENTVLGTRKVGDLVNLEVDIVAKYVERLTSPELRDDSGG